MDNVVELAGSAFVLFGWHDLESLAMAERSRESALARSRVLMHRTRSESPQQMIIHLLKGSRVGMHRHPKAKSETYVVLSGKLEVRYSLPDGSEVSCKLAPWGNSETLPTIATHRDAIWHEPSAISEECVYLEIYTGPFDKKLDVEYLSERI